MENGLRPPQKPRQSNVLVAIAGVAILPIAARRVTAGIAVRHLVSMEPKAPTRATVTFALTGI